VGRYLLAVATVIVVSWKISRLGSKCIKLNSDVQQKLQRYLAELEFFRVENMCPHNNLVINAS
jgi:hypothetical protein